MGKSTVPDGKSFQPFTVVLNTVGLVSNQFQRFPRFALAYRADILGLKQTEIFMGDGTTMSGGEPYSIRIGPYPIGTTL